jgi:PmbA protein
MINLCEYAVSQGEKAGADEIEAVWIRNIFTTVEGKLGEIREASMKKEEGIRIRAIKDKALSSYFTYQVDKEGVQTAVEKAVAAARASKRDGKWDSLPSPRRYPEVHVWDSTIEHVTSEKLTDPVIEMIQSLPQGIAVHSALNQVTLRERACCNSSGVAHEDRGTDALMDMEVVGKLKTGVTPSFKMELLSRTYDPRPQLIATSLVDRVTLFKKSETASSGEFQVIFSPETLEILLFYTLSKAVSGENVTLGKSLLAGKEGEKVASSEFTLHDNGITPEGIYSREMDDEGVPRQNTALIEEGILEGFIWNDYWAKRTGCSSTGNAFYDERINEMSIKQTAMVIAPGECNQEELYDVKDGYYILKIQGAHGSNPESGDFSVVCTPAYRIRNGEITGGVTGVMVSGNIYSLLQNIDAVGRDTRIGEISIFPHIRFSNVNVAAK